MRFSWYFFQRFLRNSLIIYPAVENVNVVAVMLVVSNPFFPPASISAHR